jgi:predicted enzyme related to lactoylglutathione lyase
MGLRIRHVVIDSNDPAPLARFWSEVTGRPVEDSDPVYTTLEDPDCRDVLLLIQRVGDAPKRTKSRVHIDLYAADPDAEAERVVALGAAKLNVVEEDEVRWVVLADPQGNEFCIIGADPTEP